ncbi:glycosyltransferase family 4 protein [Listeria grandensis]|uniref:glycosyltransferase family 4 protein n=1 Tax=Listeria grandensis TaxID=1494963 RepID=UPI00164E147D|nr:glycosyltransferase family 4 protein [Listeria grandensis]MBC6315248.1 glycosyltransferase family 4 protein [Listeria grandensis]
MRILMFGPDRTTKGGIATVIANFQNHFSSSDNTIFYAESWKEGSLFRRTFYSALGILSLPFRIIGKKIDLVHIHMAQDGSYFRKAIATRIAKQCGRKVLLHIHGSHFDQYHQMSGPRLQKHLLQTLRKADKIIVLNEDVQTYFAAYGISMEIVQNAVPIPAPSEKPVERTQISSFGQLGERKGTYDILQVAERLQDEHPEIFIYLYGDGDTKQAQAIITQKQLNNVRIGGWITAEEKEQTMQKTLIHLLPSYQEGLPMAILETMARGIPNISTYVGGIPDVMEQGKDGLLIEPGDQDALYDAISFLIEQEEERSKMGAAASHKIKSAFSMPAYNRKWDQIYTEWNE